MEKKEKGQVKKNLKILTLLPSILYNILVVFSVIIIVIIVMQRLSDSNRSLGGYKIFKVVSGSMEPKFDVGEVVICKEVSMESIKIGDALVYRGKIGDLNGRIVMHEVIKITDDGKNNLTFFAKGLNNSKGDPEINEGQVLGVVKFRSKILTLLYKLATSIYSAFAIITVLVINVFISFKSGDIEEDSEEIREKNTSKQNTKIENINQKEEKNLENSNIDTKQDFDKIENVETKRTQKKKR